MEQIINRASIFDAVRTLLGRGFSAGEVGALDAAIDRSLSGQAPLAPQHRLGALSEAFESGGAGAGTVSSGRGDPGGVSYGTWQLSSRAGTAAAFITAEGARWSSDFASARPGTTAFSDAWRTIAAREPAAFADAQHRFIERTHYRPVVAAVRRATTLDLDTRHDAVRDVTWSVAVQHAGAARILTAAVETNDRGGSRTDAAYDRALVEAIYAERVRYVLAVSARTNDPGQRRTLIAITERRYPAEKTAALAMFAPAGAALQG